MSRSVAQLHRESSRNWMIVAGILILAVLIDLARERDERPEPRRRKR